MDNHADVKAVLQDAVIMCSERCLYQSAKWAAELLDAMPESSQGDVNLSNTPRGFISAAVSPNPSPEEAKLEAKELSKYLLAKSFFDCREFDRCAAVFLPEDLLSSALSTHPDETQPSPRHGKGKARELAVKQSRQTRALPRLSQKSLFLSLYAKFMSGEKRRSEYSETVMGPQDLGTAVNKQLSVIGRFLQTWFAGRRPSPDMAAEGSQGWLEYLYGIVLAREKNMQGALEYLVESVNLYAYNWGCWLEMASLITNRDVLDNIMSKVKPNLASLMFHVHTSLELFHTSPDMAKALTHLISMFPTAPSLLANNALLAYHSKEQALAEQRFSQLLSLHPYRLDSLDHYSNLLYITNSRPKLAFLAHLCSNVDRFRPESCVVIGNYYSLLSLHEKAVQYFRRALTLDRSFLSAWTLMGHEYVELKNTHAAIESYRRAVDVNRRDFRAWYGLGQTYEVLEMHAYALWYYKKAAGLRPWDATMWQAVGACLQRMGREADGIKALKRALLASSYFDSTTTSSFGSTGPNPNLGLGHMDTEILLQIATMYDSLNETEEARAYMELCIAQEEGPADGATYPDLGESIAIHADTSFISNPDESSQHPGDQSFQQGTGGGGSAEGTGVTATTSKARMWLARYAMRLGDYAAAERLAEELCRDGQDIEEAKALVREARANIDNEAANGGGGNGASND